MAYVNCLREDASGSQGVSLTGESLAPPRSCDWDDFLNAASAHPRYSRPNTEIRAALAWHRDRF
jgi:hypothetical protein